MAVFQPNLTSRLILQQTVRLEDDLGDKWLEIGAGSGWITAEFRQVSSNRNRHYFVSDISEEAITLAMQLHDWLSPQTARIGAGLEPWEGHVFDVVVNDIAGISDPLASSSDWYQDVTCNAGRDGLRNVSSVLQCLREHLGGSGVYIVPLISLSDSLSHLSLLRDTFAEVSVSEKKLWPLPVKLAENKSLLRELASERCIEIVEKYGKVLAWTAVATATSIRSPRI